MTPTSASKPPLPLRQSTASGFFEFKIKGAKISKAKITDRCYGCRKITVLMPDSSLCRKCYPVKLKAFMELQQQYEKGDAKSKMSIDHLLT